jgi:small GTP-binding protein
MPQTFTYDVFISHSPKDAPTALELATRLDADGLRVWLDAWEINPSERAATRQKKLKRKLKQSHALILLMSAHAFAADWSTLERQTSLFRDPANQQRRFIPVRLDDAEINDTLKPFAYIDWRQSSDDQYERLLSACRPTAVAAEPTIEPQDEQPASKVLTRHKGGILSLAVTADGQRAVSGSSDGTIRVWDVATGGCLATLKGHTDTVWSVAVTADGQRFVSGSEDNTVRVWDVATGKRLATLKGHTETVWGVAVAADGRRAVSGSDDQTVRVWDVATGRLLATLEGHTSQVWSVAVTADGQRAVSGSTDGTVRVWDVATGRLLATLEGHTAPILGVAVTADGQCAVSGSYDGTIGVWDVATGKCLATLEGHTAPVWSVAVTADGRRAVSGSWDKTVRVWDVTTGKCITTLEGHTGRVYGVAVTADGQRAVSGSSDQTMRVWELPPYDEEAEDEKAAEVSAAARYSSEATRYTNAKVLLVGDSGVGKSGLAYRLTEDKFVPTISTDGVWATQLSLPHDTGNKEVEREIWLWDFAGQSDYRLVHQLFMDETALAVLVFNPQSENPFEGLGQWDRDLQRAARRPFKKLLVAGRCDRGGLMISSANIERFRQERGFAHYLETSARTGKGCEDLRAAIIESIPWDEIPWTSSPRIFKLLKEEIVKLKDEGKALLRMGELKQQLEMRLPAETFTLEQLRAVVGLLAGPGIIWQLEFGDFVLLQPERVNSYAAAVIRKVRAHTEEIGVIAEEDVLAGRLDYQGMKRLPEDEEPIVLRAMHQTFVDHGLCLREPTGKGTLLVFPSYFKRERPELEGHPAVFVTYQFNGQLDEIYSTLVVRLHHTTAFEKDQLWRFAADFKTPAGKRVGLMMIKQNEGAAEIAVYFEPGISEDTKVTFIRYVHEHLKVKAQDVVRLRHYVCTHCHTPIENRKTALERLNRGLKDILCVNCERRVPLWDLIEEKFASEEFQKRVRELEEEARISIDNESKELILVGHAFAIAGEAGQIFRPTPNSDWGIDGEIEFKNDKGEASGRRVYLQLKSGDSYLYKRKADEQEVFTIKKTRQAEYWLNQAYPVMLVIRTSDGQIRWMNVTDYLQRQGKTAKQIIFDGEPFTALSVSRLRDRLLAQS